MIWGVGGLSYSFVRPTGPPSVGRMGAGVAPSEERASLLQLRGALVSLRRDLEALGSALRASGTGGQPVRLTSLSDLGLDPDGEVASLASLAEVNTTPTSFGPFAPAFTGASTAAPIVTGIYDGSGGNDVLTFSIQRGGTIGSNRQSIRIDVFDGSGRRLDRVLLQPNEAARTEHTLPNGLVISFGAGRLDTNDSFQVGVSATVGSRVDPDKPLNGVGASYANLEYRTVVSTGSFLVNGTRITVNASDTLQQVLSRINASGAGVTATFDAASETVQMAQNTAGAAPTIALSQDTSGFLAAVKLSGAQVTPGIDPDPVRPLAQLPAFASVQSGALGINGVAIAVDPSRDSLTDIVARINASSSGVSARLDAGAQRLVLTPLDPSQPVTLIDGGTGFFRSAQIPTGVHDPRSDGVASGARVSRAFAKVADRLNALFVDAGASATLRAPLTALRGELQSAATETLGGEGARLRSRFGVEFDFRDDTGPIVAFRGRERVALERALRTRPAAVRAALLGSNGGRQGLITALLERLDGAASGIESRLDAKGLYVDTIG